MVRILSAVEKSSPAGSTVDVDFESSGFLRQAFALAPGVTYVFNHKTKCNEYANRSIAELLGYTAQELIEMGGDIVDRTVHAEDVPALAAYFDKLEMLADGETASFEYRGIAKDGSIIWLRNIDTVFQRAKDGSLLRHIGIATDITAQKSAERALHALNAELELRVAERTRALEELNNELEERVQARTEQLCAANRELEQLSYVASHDLKGPIDNLSGLTDMLAEAGADFSPEQIETIEWMQDVCRRASEKLEALVRVAQAEAIDREPFCDVDLAEAFGRVATRLGARISNAGARIATEFECPEVHFIPHEVDYILQSLICNALAYRSEDRPLQISICSLQADDGVMLTVSDNGSGFDQERDHDRVFGLFQRAHATPEGAGVSLYSIRRIMQSIGGSIEAKSTPGTGSTFDLWFPGRRD